VAKIIMIGFEQIIEREEFDMDEAIVYTLLLRDLVKGGRRSFPMGVDLVDRFD
jgi:hypothetical protein